MTNELPKELPFSGVTCDNETDTCKIWYVATKNNKTTTITIEDIPMRYFGSKPNLAESKLENTVNNTKATID